jgi:hypothetical protein
MKYARSVLPLLLLLACPLAAQVAQPLTNKDVIALVKVGIADDVIVDKIKRSRCRFDTEASTLAELKQAGVSNEVLKAMVNAPGDSPQVGEPPAAPGPKPRRVLADNALPSYGSPQELLKLRYVYVTSDEPGSRQLIINEFKKYEGLSVVSSPGDAEFVLECIVKSSTEARGRQPSHYLRTLLTAYRIDDEGGKRVLWTENETYEEQNGLSFSRPNEVNLARHFITMLRKMRGEKK